MSRSTYHQVIIVGSGFSGQSAAIELKRMGIDDFRILERRDFMGGVWCQNTYPGAAVDVQSPLYSLSTEPYDWSQMFAGQDELKQYTHHVIAKHRLQDKALLGRSVEKISWDDTQQCWRLEVKRQKDSATEHYAAQFVINASGALSTPLTPEFEGRDSFAGKSFHTSNWDHSYDYRGKRVAVIGSGASAAQVIPAIAPDVGQLHVFQRSPHWVLPRPDYVFKPWQRSLLRTKPVYKALRALIYAGLELRLIGFKYCHTLLKLIAQRKAFRYIKKQIKDPVLRDKVTPDYTLGCKRVVLSSTLYPAYNRSNVMLHSKEDGIQSITEKGIVTQSGETIDLDLIVYSTGYDAADSVITYPVVGKEGQTIAAFWDEYPRAYLGTSVPNFPNLFIMTGPNTGVGHTSAIFIVESQLRYIKQAINSVIKHNRKSIEVTSEAEHRYTRNIHKEMEKTVWKTGGCNSWYQSKDGHIVIVFPGFSFIFRRWAEAFRGQDHEWV